MMVLLQWLFYLLYALLIARVVLSFVMPMLGTRPHPIFVNINAIVMQITEPILAPIRRYTTFGMFDFSPMVAIIVLGLIQRVISNALG
jgi:YggT family protein